MEEEADWFMRRRQQRGFALLFVFALAGIVAILLYNELPRAVFESQRAKEELLVNRGQEYQRGIQLYYRKFRKYPATMEELEKSSGIRFLRRRYVDPFSGKDDWRLVHVGPTGQFTDSKVIKPPQPAQGSSLSTSAADPNQTPQQDPNDPAVRRRASDVSASEIGSNPATSASAVGDPNQQNLGPPPPPGAMTNTPGFPGRTMPGAPPSSPYPAYSVGGVGSMGSTPAAPGPSLSTGLPNTSFPSATISSQQGGMQPVPIPNLNSGGFPQNTQPGQRPLTAEQISPALNVIQNLLTRPRTPPPGIGQEGGMGANPLGPMTNPGGTFLAGGPAAGGGNGQFGGGGIAGVASKKEGKGIKIINERERIEEWEFIYDWGKDRGGRPGPNSQGQNQVPGGLNPAQGMGMGMGMGMGGGQQQQPGSGFGSRDQGRQQRPPGGGGFGLQQPFGRPRN